MPFLVLPTLQRRVKVWRAVQGPPREVFFLQVHKPGELCQSDFTSMNSLGVTIQRQPFDHLLYHFVLTYSNWETGTICFSESFETLSEGLQNALREAGGVPFLHRTDQLSPRVEVWYAQQGIETMPRLRGEGKHRTQYRHIIDWRVRKPGAFENCRYREELFPTHRFRMAYDWLKGRHPSRAAKEYLGILHLAARKNETAVDDALRTLIEKELPTSIEAIENILRSEGQISLPAQIVILDVDLGAYDALLTSKEVLPCYQTN